MNILFVLQRYPGFGGIENVTATLSEAFCSKLGHNVVIFSTSRQKNDSQMIKNKCWKYITSDLKGSLLISFFQRIVKENNIDLIIYQDSYVPEEYLIENLDRSNLKIIVCEHNTPNCLEIGLKNSVKETPFFSFKGLVRRILYPSRLCDTYTKSKKRHQKMVDLSDSYILLSETFKQTLLDYYGIKSKKIIAITNPISSEKQYKFKSQAKEKIVLFVGRLTKQKGVNYLIDIWKIIEKNHHDWKLMIIGDGEERNFIEKKISKYNLKNIHIEGYQSDVYSYYRKASILFMTSIFEGFGLVLAEAMSYGVVPIAFNSYESISDIIDHNFNGFLVTPFDLQEYTKKFEMAISDDNFDKMSYNAISKSNNFDILNVLKYWEHILK